MESGRARVGAAEKAVIAYKFAKAAFEVALGLGLAILLAAGLVWRAEAWLAAALPPGLAHELAHALTPKHVAFTTVALVGDGLVSGFEGWALRRGKPWGRWIVVGATGAFIPYELATLVHHPHALSAGLLLVNVAVVVTLAVRARNALAIRRQLDDEPRAAARRALAPDAPRVRPHDLPTQVQA